MDKSLHDLVEKHAKIARQNATHAARKIGRGASRRGEFWAVGASPFPRILCDILTKSYKKIVHLTHKQQKYLFVSNPRPTLFD